jgi:hypothetical protein
MPGHFCAAYSLLGASRDESAHRYCFTRQPSSGRRVSAERWDHRVWLCGLRTSYPILVATSMRFCHRQHPSREEGIRHSPSIVWSAEMLEAKNVSYRRTVWRFGQNAKPHETRILFSARAQVVSSVLPRALARRIRAEFVRPPTGATDARPPAAQRPGPGPS